MGESCPPAPEGDGAGEPWKDVPVFPVPPRECCAGTVQGVQEKAVPEVSHPCDTPAALPAPLAPLGVTKAAFGDREHLRTRGVYGQQE